MKQIELAKELNVSKAYISMVLSGKKQPSQRVAEKLKEVNLLVNSERKIDYPKSCSSASSDTSPEAKLLGIIAF